MQTSGSGNEAWTVRRLLGWTRDYFRARGMESPRLCAELLLAHALGCERIELYTRYELEPDAQALERFRRNVREAARGAPIAYLTGSKDFFSLNFEVCPDVLVPRPETELLVERAIHLARSASNAALRILDVGCGSGCIAVALARNLPAAALFASDISEPALAVARRNAERLGVAARIEFRCGDLLAPWSADPPFDLIVSNPPYVGTLEADSLPASVRDFEPHRALFAGPDGLEVIRRLIDQAPPHLAAGGSLLCEMAWNQSAVVRELLDARGWRDIVVYRDHLNHERVVYARPPG